MTHEDQRPKTAGQCGPCSPSQRNKYFRGKPMTVSDYQAEQAYMIGRRRLISRSLLGWGRVSGFHVSAEHDGRLLKVCDGLALDQCGRELLACKDTLIECAEDLLWLERDDCGWKIKEPAEESDDRDHRTSQQGEEQSADQTAEEADPCRGPWPRYILSAHYAEIPVDGLRVDDGCGSTTCEANHVCETVVFSLRPADEEGPPFVEHHCEFVDEEFEHVQHHAGESFVERHCGGVDGLCIHCRHWPDGDRCDPCSKPRLVKWRGICVAVNEGVPLAQLHVEVGKCDIRVSEVIRVIGCCELTRIRDVGWSDWLKRDGRRVRFSEFGDMFDAPADLGTPRDRRRRRDPGPSNTRFWVCFSGPVQVSSLAPDVMTISLIERAGDECKDHVRRIPIVGVAVARRTCGDPRGTTRAFRPLVHGKYWAGEINPDDTSGFDRPTLVEIDVRTEIMADAGGREIAGGGRQVPSSACVPGIHFLSSFTVVPDERDTGGSEAEYAEPSAQEA